MFKNEEYSSFLNIFTKNKIYNIIIFTSFISSLVACSQALTKNACTLVKSEDNNAKVEGQRSMASSRLNTCDSAVLEF